MSVRHSVPDAGELVVPETTIEEALAKSVGLAARLFRPIGPKGVNEWRRPCPACGKSLKARTWSDLGAALEKHHRNCPQKAELDRLLALAAKEVAR
jgi:hypothetical protein